MAISQRELDFMAAENARRQKQLALLRQADVDDIIVPVVERLGHKHFALQLGLGIEKVDRVYHWTERRNGQRSPAELLVEVLDEDPQAMAKLCRLTRYEIPKKLARLPADERAEEYRHSLLKFGAAGEAEVQRIDAGRVGEPLWREKARAEGWLSPEDQKPGGAR